MHRLVPRRRTATLLATLIASATTGTAHAQLAPYHVELSETLTYHSNLFRTAEDERRDVVSNTALTLGLDQPIGRQRVYASATARGLLYKNNDDLNSAGYDLKLGSNWEAGSRWSGVARLNLSQQQASFERYGALTGAQTTRNNERARIVDLSAQYGGASLLSLQALANHTDIDYSASGFGSRDRRSNMVGAGVSARPGGPWTLRLTGRKTNGEYPNALIGTATVSDDYDRRDIDLVTEYTPTGLSNFLLRLTHTKEEHDLDATRDFSGLTGELVWNYQLSGKVTSALRYSRETGSGSSVSSLVVTPPTGAPVSTASYLTDSRLTSRVGLDLVWNATAKLRFGAGFEYARERYDNQFTVGDGSVSTDGRGHSRRLRVDGSFLVTRVWTLTCGATHEERSTAVTVGSSAFGYDATTAYCGATLSLR